MRPDKELEAFIAENIQSLVMWELLVFLCNNPGITDTADGIASRLGRRRVDLLDPLKVLAQQKILEKYGETGDPIFLFRPSPKLSHALDKFMQYHNSKQGKILIWSQLLKQGIR